jgi:hypothetical protein
MIPGRLGLGRDSNYYLFGFVGDEYTYAQHIQPLVAGASAANPDNYAGDRGAISPFFLENALRAFLTATGLKVVDLFWAWRIFFPPVLLACAVLLARACCPHGCTRRTTWGTALAIASGTSAFIALYFLYDRLTSLMPLQGWLNRIPTNVEFPLSVLIAWACVRFIRRPSAGRGACLSVLCAALVYARFYAAIPWAICIPVMMAGLLISKRMNLRVALITAATLGAALAPWAAVLMFNSSRPVYQQMVARYFPAQAYRFPVTWPLLLSLAGVLLAQSFFVHRRFRMLLRGCALALIALIFVSGAFSFAREVTQFDRYTSFYLVAVVLGFCLMLGSRIPSLRGEVATVFGQSWAIRLSLVAVATALVVGKANATFDFGACGGQYESVREDLPTVHAYRWIAEHTPAEAVFLVDDGCDWSGPPLSQSNESDLCVPGSREYTLWVRSDLFSIVARRQVIFHSRMYGNLLSDRDVGELVFLHCGTFGAGKEAGISPEAYMQALKRFKPTHILWRNTPGLRGYGAKLLKYKTLLYSDGVCQVWEIGTW